MFHEQRLESTRPVRDPKGRTIFFEQTPITRLHDILRIQYGTDKATLLVSLKADAAGRLKTATTKNSGLRLAFVVEDEAVMAVVWEGDYGIDNGEMQLSFRDEDLARKLVTTISSCIRTRPE